MMIKVGDFNDFIVTRKTDLGYMLKNKEEEILLHNKQTNGANLEVGSNVYAFVQLDSKGRMIATMEEALATTNRFGFAKVVEVKTELGVFLSINTFKDILLSKDNLPNDYALWPRVDDQLLIKLVYKNNHLNAKIATKEDLSHIELVKYEKGTLIDAIVSRSSNLAINAISLDKNYIFISTKQFRAKYRIGEKVKVMVIGYHDDELVGSLNKIKEEQALDDEQIILEYLIKHQGKMKYTAKTNSEEIEAVFHMSRKAFKRALGDLYKNKKVICNDYETVLNEEL